MTQMRKLIAWAALLLSLRCQGNETQAEGSDAAGTPRNKFGWATHEGLAIIDRHNLDDMRRSSGAVIAIFCDFNCTACQETMPFFRKVAEHFADSRGWSINTGLVDVKKEQQLSRQFGIEKLPQLMVFTHINKGYYAGEWNIPEIEAFVHHIWFPRMREIEDIKHVDLLLKDCYLCAFLYMREWDQRAQQWFWEAANHNKLMRLFWGRQDKIGDFEESTGNYTVVLYRDFDDGKKVYNKGDSPSIKQFAAFFEQHVTQKLLEVTPNTLEKLLNREEPVMYLLTANVTGANAQMFRKLALEKIGLMFAYGSWEDEFVQKLAALLGVRREEGDLAVLTRVENGLMHKYRPSELTHESLNQLLDQFKSGNAPRFFKSAVPTSPGQLTGSNFDSLVINIQQNVLVLVTANYCLHSKRAEEFLEDFESRIEPNSDLSILKIEGTENEHWSFEGRSFPLLKLYRSYDKTAPVDYEGERTFESLKEFLERETGRKLAERQAVGGEL